MSFTFHRGVPKPEERKLHVTDPIVRAVITRLQERSERGVQKYGTTLDANNLSLDEWLNHLQEELLDAANYIEKIRQLLKDKQ